MGTESNYGMKSVKLWINLDSKKRETDNKLEWKVKVWLLFWKAWTEKNNFLPRNRNFRADLDQITSFGYRLFLVDKIKLFVHNWQHTETDISS